MTGVMPYNRPDGRPGGLSRMRLGTSLALFAGGLTLAANACDYPEFSFRRAATDAGTTSSGGGGQGGVAGGTGGTGATAPECGPIGGPANCPPAEKCTIVDPIVGTAGCVPYGAISNFAVCTTNEQCGALSWCDQPTGVCRPVCVDAAQCLSYALGLGTQCAPTLQDGQPVTGGLKVCTVYCNFQDNVPCGALDGPITYT